ncbi:MAG: hypothetical protein H6R26_896 [Proteobacteria bacterium]|nr:hypothetical protein [Pseudomonadota bacterium]
MSTGGFDYGSLAFSGVAPSGADRFAALTAGGMRAGKLDLLLHLLANLPRSILLLGARGTGKTTLLRQVQARSQENWSVCYLAATANLSLDSIFKELMEVLRQPVPSGGKASLEKALVEQLDQLSRSNRKLVVLLDDADVLTPGLLGAVCQFARLHPVLKLAFSLRPEDLPQKAASDALALADAHFVELAPGEPETPVPPQPQLVRPSRPRPLEVGLTKAFRFVLRHREGLGQRPFAWVAFTALAAAAATGVVVGLLWHGEAPPPPAAETSPPARPALAPLPPVTVTKSLPATEPSAAPAAPPPQQPAAVAIPSGTPLPTPTEAPAAATPQPTPATAAPQPSPPAKLKSAEKPPSKAKPKPKATPKATPKPKKKPRPVLVSPFEEPASTPAVPE